MRLRVVRAFVSYFQGGARACVLVHRHYAVWDMGDEGGEKMKKFKSIKKKNRRKLHVIMHHRSSQVDGG